MTIMHIYIQYYVMYTIDSEILFEYDLNWLQWAGFMVAVGGRLSLLYLFAFIFFIHMHTYLLNTCNKTI